VWLMLWVFSFLDTYSLAAFKSVEICMIFYESLWFPNQLRFAGFFYLVNFYPVSVDYTVWRKTAS
jgi:hypothetical protein